LDEEKISETVHKTFWMMAHGNYNFRVRALFVLNFGSDNQQTIDFWSNTFSLAVVGCTQPLPPGLLL
jgi:hypothetical protein